MNNELDIGIIVNAKEYLGLKSQTVYMDTFGLYISPSIKKNHKNKLIYFDFAPNNLNEAIEKFKFYDFFCCDNLETV